MTTAGDLEYHDGTSATRLPVGADARMVLSVDLTLPGKLKWVPLSALTAFFVWTSVLPYDSIVALNPSFTPNAYEGVNQLTPSATYAGTIGGP